MGAVCRFALSSFINQKLCIVFPSGTFSVNVIGSLVMGFVFCLFQDITVSIETRIFLTIGFLGGFTTFSSFSIETVNLLRDGEHKFFLYNVIFTNVFCLLSTFTGMYIAKFLTRTIR